MPLLRQMEAPVIPARKSLREALKGMDTLWGRCMAFELWWRFWRHGRYATDDQFRAISKRWVGVEYPPRHVS